MQKFASKKWQFYAKIVFFSIFAWFLLVISEKNTNFAARKVLLHYEKFTDYNQSDSFIECVDVAGGYAGAAEWGGALLRIRIALCDSR